jgi:SAM-dependent methyltransferase
VTAGDDWRAALEAWAIPAPILAKAEESPWGFPPVLFQAPASRGTTPSDERAREALGALASVLDVGSGGGAATFALVPDVRQAFAVDTQAEMLAMYEVNARERGVSATTVQGSWPDIATSVPVVDVVLAHHVVYNVAPIVPFLRALDDHARRRVVLEMTERHPMTWLNEAWAHFWGVERPTGPTSSDLIAVLGEMGLPATEERFEGPTWLEESPELMANFARIRLCLPASRNDEVRAFLAKHPALPSRSLVTLWWDASS